MIQIATQDHLARVTAMTRAAKIDTLEQEILARAPRPAARVHVSLSPVESRSEFLSYVRLSGPKEDVLDFAAVLFDEVKGMVRPDGTLPLSVSAIESESSEHIQIVIARRCTRANAVQLCVCAVKRVGPRAVSTPPHPFR